MITPLRDTLAAVLQQQDQHWHLPEKASTFAADHDALYVFTLWVGYVFFFGILGVLIYSVVNYRRKTEDQPPASTITHHTAIEVTWTVVPLILVMIMFAWGWKGYADMTLAPADSLQFEVRAKRWQWSFKHPGETEFVTPDLYVPIGEPCQLTMSSADVLHSFFIPAFRVKRDVLPGRFQTVWFEATTLGDFNIFCAEYCGKDHSTMIGQVHVITKADWEKYTSGEEKAPWNPFRYGDTEADQLFNGEIVYKQNCRQCHSIDGTRGTGPSFKGIWGKDEKLADGRTIKVDEAYVVKSLREPSADVVDTFPSSGMLAFSEKDLDDEKVEWVTKYIKSLTK